MGKRPKGWCYADPQRSIIIPQNSLRLDVADEAETVLVRHRKKNWRSSTMFLTVGEASWVCNLEGYTET